MSDHDKLDEATRLFQNAQVEHQAFDTPSDTPCGKTCLPLIMQKREIVVINKRLEAGDRALDAIPLIVEEMKAIRANSETMMKDMATTKTDVASTKVDIAATKDVVEAWGRIVGTAKLMSGISTAIKVVTPIALLLGLVYLFIYDPQLALQKVRLWLGAK